MKKIIKILSSLKLAVFVILGLCCVVAAGTIIESKYDAQAASKLVYRSWWLFSFLLLLVTNLTAVMVDRWPWKAKHAPFIMAHIGIILLLLGAALTVRFGIDGNMRIDIGGKSHQVSVNGTELNLYSSFDGQNFTRLFGSEVDFFLNPPDSDKKTMTLNTDEGDIKILEYIPYALAEQQVKAVQDPRLGAGLRIQLSNPRVHFVQWLVQRTPNDRIFKDLGPAAVTWLAEKDFPKTGSGRNELFLSPIVNGQDQKIHYLISYKDSGRKPQAGYVQEGQSVQTGWMGIELKILRFLPQALEETVFQAAPGPTELTNQAVRFDYKGQQHWLQLDDSVKLFSQKAVYILAYGHQHIDTGFDLSLKKFSVGHYPGSMMASSYSSIVDVPGAGEKEISMNEPLHHNGLTIYQASFQSDDKGQPIASIFSVNYDPGRWFKYLGSLIIVAGTILLFYNKRKASRRLGPEVLS
jgi:hypothetical protein